MLLRFGFSNFLSIKDYQELNLSASAINDEPNYLLASENLNINILPVIGIYGANASGKSNVLNAFSFFTYFILNSQIKGATKGNIPRSPFLLDSSSKEEPSNFDCDFLFKGSRYHYGFTINDQEVEEEWLYTYPKGSRRVLFQRNIREEEAFYFGSHLKGKNKTIEELTRKNSLFLSSAAQNNHETLTEIYNFFEDNFIFRFDQEPLSPLILAKILDKTPLKDKIISFVKNADIGINEAKIEEVELDTSTVEMQEELFSLFNKHLPNQKINIKTESTIKTIKLGHNKEDGSSAFFDLDEESRGTLCLLSIIGPTLDALANGKVFIVDELDSSMHPTLSQKLVSLFTTPKANPNGAQLIFTTHDTNLLCYNTLRRDSIWFTEKSKKGETHLYPLTDINTRKTDNIGKGYLQGRFGAIPFLGQIEELFKLSERA